MLLVAPLGHAAVQRAVVASEHQAAAPGTYHYTESWSPPLPEDIIGEAGERIEIKPSVQAPLEEWDWNDEGVVCRFIKLEQKVLAEKASEEEVHAYKQMRRHRTSVLFADKYIRDYAEVQRLQKLSQRLAEIQQYLTPIRTK